MKRICLYCEGSGDIYDLNGHIKDCPECFGKRKLLVEPNPHDPVQIKYLAQKFLQADIPEGINSLMDKPCQDYERYAILALTAMADDALYEAIC